jgi:hypothetical protein
LRIELLKKSNTWSPEFAENMRPKQKLHGFTSTVNIYILTQKELRGDPTRRI